MLKKHTPFSRYLLLMLAGLMLMLFAAVACGGDDDDEATSTPAAVAPTSTTAAAATATTEPAAAATTKPAAAATTKPAATATTKPPASTGPSGSLAVAVTSIEAGVGIPGFCSSNCTEDMVQASVLETLARVKIGDLSGVEDLDGGLATGWTLDPDLEFVDFDVRKGVQFHQDWGELTADDIAWTINNANRVTNPDSISGQAGELGAMIEKSEAISEYVVRMNFSVFDARWLRFRFSDFEESIGINSKKVWDDLGEEGMRSLIIGTGPYEVEYWREHDEILLKAVEGHWRQTPNVASLKIIEVKEPSAQLAMLLTGTIAAGRGSLKDWPQLIDEEGFVGLTGTAMEGIMSVGWSGNYWEMNSARTGDKLDRVRDTSLPWVGDPFENGDTFDENTPSMQRSLLVRRALGHAIDRVGINESLMAGLGGPVYFSYQMSPTSPFFKKGTWPDGWEIPYDLDKAKGWLDEAGYSDGFKMTVHINPDDSSGAEVMEALAGLWQIDLGIEVALERTAYATFRPSLVQRTNTMPFFSPGDGSSFNNPLDAARGFTMSSWSEGGYGVAMEIPFAAETYVLTAQNPDKDVRIAANVEFINYSIDWALASGIVVTPGYSLYNPDIIADWPIHPISNGAFNAMNNFEYITLK